MNIMCGGISMVALFMVTAGLAAVYGITTFGPKLSLQNKIKAAKAKMKELMLAHNNQALRNRDKMKDDAIAQLSDHPLAISTRLQELERKQSV